MREMKDSGLDWIGMIPESWRIFRLKYLLVKPLQYGASETGIEFTKDLPRYIRITDIDENNHLKESGKLSLSLEKAKPYILKDNCVLFARSGATVGKTFFYKRSYGLAAFAGYLIAAFTKSTLLCANWLYYYTQSNTYWNWVRQIFNQSTIQNIGADKYNNLPVTVPTLKEQQAIANFLDAKCDDIDSLTGDIQKQIDILKEYKKSVITQAITKGIDPNVEMKETVSPYWNEIPKKWYLSDIKYIFKIVKRIAGKEGYDILSVTQKGLKIKDVSHNEGQIAENYKGYQFVYPGDFVMNHMDLLTGWVDLSKLFGVTSPDYRVFKLRDNHVNEARYYKYVMQCCYSCRIFYSLGQGVSTLGRWRLQTSAFNNFLIPVPPITEQKVIADFLDSKCADIDAAIAGKQKQLDVLKEYKKSLIYEYVTGKKEVPCRE